MLGDHLAASSAKSKSRKAAARKPEPAYIVYSGAWKIATLAGGSIVAVYAVWTAWVGFGWWIPAGVSLVDDHITKAVAPISTKVDLQGLSLLNGRLEALKISRQLQLNDKAKWDVQSHTTQDQTALQLIAQQQHEIDDQIKLIDGQIAKLAAQLQSDSK